MGAAKSEKSALQVCSFIKKFPKGAEVKSIRQWVLIAVLVFVFASGTCWAQATTAQIIGSVKDQSGAVLPGVEVTVTQTATGGKRSIVTNETGNYVLASLPVGPYVLEAALPGFRSYVQTGIVLQVDASPTINVVLQVGQNSEQVEVAADAGLVETRTTAIGQVVTNQQVAEMPLNGRDAHELIFLAGMANYPGQGSMNSIRNYPTVVVSVAGGNGDGVSYLLDGSIWQDPYNSLSLPLPFPDALQEFKVETSAMPAQYGFHATATVNAVTKSGTNEFHGDLFEFVRNGIFNARDAFAAETRHVKAQSVRRHHRRSDQERQTVLLRRLSEDFPALRRRPEHRLHPDTGGARRRLHGIGLSALQ